MNLLVRSLVSAVVFVMFIPGVLVKLGGKYALIVHAVLFVLVHTLVSHLLLGVLGGVASVASVGKGLVLYDSQQSGLGDQGKIGPPPLSSFTLKGGADGGYGQFTRL